MSEGVVASDAGDENVTSHRRLVHRSSLIAVAVGLVVTGALSWVAYTAKDHNNLRLLGLQTQESGAVLSAVVTEIQTPLASAAGIAQTTNGSVQAFESYITPVVGKRGVFVSASLWDVRSGTPVLLARVGGPAMLATNPARTAAFFSGIEAKPVLGVTGILGTGSGRLAYAFSADPASPDFVVAAETALPPHHYATIKRRSAFSDLNFALYLGHTTKPSALLEASVHQLPLSGQTVATSVPFGDAQFNFVASANGELGGTLSEDLWWLIAIVGIAMTLGAAGMTERLVRSRLRAQEIADENGRLYSQQRGVAETLQHALLPEELPSMPGLELAVRYVPGVEELEIGGDWYDVVQLSESRLLFVVGDVSGRGLRAAAIMASLRFAIRAYALQGDAPATIFEKLGRTLDISRDEHFATVLCALVDVDQQRMTLVNAGHPNGLIRTPEGTRFVNTEIGPPIGVSSRTNYATTTVDIGPGSILFGFTDGLVERRGENLDVSLSRIKNLVAQADASVGLDQMLQDLIADLTPDGPADDVALLGLRWN